MQYRNNIAKTSHAGMAIIIRRLDGIEEIIKSSCFVCTCNLIHSLIDIIDYVNVVYNIYVCMHSLFFFLKYFQNADCFYYCEPILGHFQVGMSAAIGNVPVCADYCNKWFDVCRDDMTCVKHWLEDFMFDEGFQNQYPRDPTTSYRTFREEYS